VPRRHLRLVLDEHERPQRPRLHHRDRGPQGRDPHHPAAAHGSDQGPRPRLHHFYAQYASIRPWLQTVTTTPSGKERLQSPEQREKLDGLYECILCACCSTACPSYWWNSDKFLGPAILLQAYRWLADSRDEMTGERLDAARGPVPALPLPHDHELRQRLPQGPQPGQAIAEIKKLQVERQI
jgi:succinate dehydrogenase / fumarate reductase iron-sulfur subunit